MWYCKLCACFNSVVCGTVYIVVHVFSAVRCSVVELVVMMAEIRDDSFQVQFTLSRQYFSYFWWVVVAMRSRTKTSLSYSPEYTSIKYNWSLSVFNFTNNSLLPKSCVWDFTKESADSCGCWNLMTPIQIQHHNCELSFSPKGSWHRFLVTNCQENTSV